MQKEQNRENIVRKSKKKQQHRKMRKKIIFLCMVMFLLGVLCGKIVFAKDEPDEISYAEIAGDSENETAFWTKFAGNSENESAEKRVNINEGRAEQGNAVEQDWRLVLVNSTHFMEKDYVPDLTEIENNYYFDARAAEDLKAMLAAGRAEGLDFWICSAYRTMEKQSSLYENKVSRLMNEEGLSYKEAYKQAGNTVAYPGTSEHQLGLAVDIVAKDYQQLDDRQANTEEAKWLKAHCAEYGFILRYPLDKTEETGIIFEPWHYRYVGKEAAKEIMEQGICLEEYLTDSEQI